MRMVLLAAALALAGCATTLSSVPSMPPAAAEVPGDLVACFNRLVPAPERGKLAVEQAYRLIGQLKKSELEKSQCGKRLIRWHNASR